MDVVVVSGHMVDAPGRAAPRFPSDQVSRVAAEVRDVLAGWEVGPQTTLITGGARGADILAAEEAHARGARVVLLLAAEPDAFVRSSVALDGTDWDERFRRLLDVADVDVIAAAGEDMYARANAEIVDTATRLAGSARLRALLVWNGRQGDGPGGTRDFLARLAIPREQIRVIDPTARLYEARQTAPGPKKLLALDGGGIRGLLTLEILAEIERQLSEQHGRDVPLAEFFDYIGGTSTGAIIAAALALGRPVAEVRAKYEALGRKVFKPRLLGLRARAKYRDEPLTEELEAYFTGSPTLGDPRLRTLLLLVMHNVTTDSPWPLSNNTRARYNRAERYLRDPPDRNLDLPLTRLLRGSTAAPTYFPPQEIMVGDRAFTFQDGGVTPFNNPALLMVLMATLPEYGLRWATGERELLVVSAGTGASAAIHPGRLARLYQPLNLPGVFMNGASTVQDLLCRSLGTTRAGNLIDLEFGDRRDVTGLGGRSLFTYLRYNAELTAPALTAAGITGARRQRRVRKLDATGSMHDLQALGRRVGAGIDVGRDFAGFLR